MRKVYVIYRTKHNDLELRDDWGNFVQQLTWYDCPAGEMKFQKIEDERLHERLCCLHERMTLSTYLYYVQFDKKKIVLEP